MTNNFEGPPKPPITDPERLRIERERRHNEKLKARKEHKVYLGDVAEKLFHQLTAEQGSNGATFVSPEYAEESVCAGAAFEQTKTANEFMDRYNDFLNSVNKNLRSDQDYLQAEVSSRQFGRGDDSVKIANDEVLPKDARILVQVKFTTTVS